MNWHLWRQNTAVLRAYKFYVAIYCTKIYLAGTTLFTYNLCWLQYFERYYLVKYPDIPGISSTRLTTFYFYSAFSLLYFFLRFFWLYVNSTWGSLLSTRFIHMCVNCTVYSAHFTLYTLNFTFYTVLCTARSELDKDWCFWLSWCVLCTPHNL